MSKQKGKSKKQAKKNFLPLIIIGSIVILFAVVFTAVSIATSRAGQVVGNTYEAVKIKVTITSDAEAKLIQLGVSAKDLSDGILKELKNNPINFDPEKEGTDLTVNGSHIKFMGVEYKRSFGKLITTIEYSDGITVKVVLKEKK